MKSPHEFEEVDENEINEQRDYPLIRNEEECEILESNCELIWKFTTNKLTSSTYLFTVLKVKKEKGAVWTCEHRLTLIEEVRSYRYIWDMKSNDHKKKKLATASWRKMVDYINARHGTEFTGKWVLMWHFWRGSVESLMGVFSVFLSASVENPKGQIFLVKRGMRKTKTGSGLGNAPKKWMYFNHVHWTQGRASGKHMKHILK